jgi:hypothetical protein
MKEYPILFSASMVKAILDGTKTQTRRVVKPRGVSDDVAQWLHAMAKGVDMPCPYGKPGDVLWVREAWDFRHWGEPGNPFRVMVSYGADGFQKLCQSPHDWNPMLYNQPRWRPSIHMPRWACRIELEIVSVRAERVQEITRNDAKAEGANFVWRWDASRKPELHKRGLLNPYIANYSVLWDEINEKRGFGWNVNPFVWVIEFQRRGITQLAPDAGDSAVSTSLSHASALSTSQAEPTPTQRG